VTGGRGGGEGRGREKMGVVETSKRGERDRRRHFLQLTVRPYSIKTEERNGG
jgi:hypothetical protein